MAATKKATNRISKNGKGTAIVEKEIRIAPLNVGKFPLTLIGMSQLVVHNFDEKSRQQMLEQQLGPSPTKKKDRKPRCPEQEYVESLHWVKGDKPSFEYDEQNKKWIFDKKSITRLVSKGTFGIPLTAFKGAIVSSCRSTGYHMTEMRQMVFVSSDDDSEYAIIRGSVPQCREDIVRIDGGRTPMVRFRPYFDPWETTIIVEHNRDLITEEQVVNLFQTAGFSVGVMEGRPEKAALGWGRWKVKGT